MSEIEGFLDRPDGSRLAGRRVEGAGPTVVWLGGFKSDMTGTKAEALADWALAQGRAYVRFDYFGHGASSGDFAEKLMAPEIPPEGRAALAANGVWLRPSEYGDPYPITRNLLEDGARWSILGGEPIPIQIPVRILQGGEDPDVPWRHALELAQGLKGDDVVFTLIKDGDHRLSRPQDIARLIAVVEEF